jgi:xylan 1,4-beta-xylosidase
MSWKFRCFAAFIASVTAFAPLTMSGVAQAPQAVNLSIDAHAAETPFPHFWEKTFGSGRAILALRDDYRKDLDTVHGATDFESVRFHGIFNDEVGLYDPDRSTKNPGQAAVAANEASVYNFSYVDQIYDGLLAHHVRPFVEMSFMPKKMASDPAALQPFWYKPNVSPPKDYALWDGMIEAFAQHLIARYGIAEVATWKFEVWNEPNLDFWGGDPKQSSYFTLYDHTVRALKAVSPQLLVGGPSTAQAAWVTPFLEHVKQEKVPIDFVSTHVYANDTAKDVFKTDEQIPRDQMVARSVKKVHEEIAQSAFPKLPLIFSEYNASYANEPNVTDSTYMGPWLANTIRLCDGLTESMAYWSFSDVFEEQGVTRTPFYGGFGLIAEDGIPKAALNVFAALHKLGDKRLASDSDTALITKRKDGAVVVAFWNYAAPDGVGKDIQPKYTAPGAPGPVKHFNLTLTGMSKSSKVAIVRVDDEHGNVLKAYDGMGRPATPSREQILQLRIAGRAAPAEAASFLDGKLQVDVPTHGLVVMEIR